MKATTIISFCLSSFAVLASAYPIYKADVVNCRSSPGTSGAVVKTYKINTDVELTCQTSGETINGNALWDKTSDGCYVADYYIKTGSTGYVASECSAGGSGESGSAGPITDDYPYKGQCDSVDPWGYYICQCTSFVAFRVNKRLGVKFHNYYKGPNWGNANTWDEAARKTGVAMNSTPNPGAVAQTNAGVYGHVAWVAKVSGNSVVVEEYNHSGTRRYSTRTVPKSSFDNYIHLK
ncbi:CHAP-domain-containing protein [Linderina pennispora]|uniref:CHAP-domain-containing protein n=1 Tax=Linderina pennispora TaxID=61395 RepID=A0A1Y1W861_9FUNG|nr:CHAP-domain-containing protein [Linderina pennispora]ORX69721.1 CHAP-domain-containing protein [Linderina pennispora]